MAKAEKSPKVTSFTPHRSVIQQAQLTRITLEHRQISSMLLESEKWLRIAEARNPKLNKAKFLQDLLSRKETLASEINKLHKTVKYVPATTLGYGPLGFEIPDWTKILTEFDPLEQAKKYYPWANPVPEVIPGPFRRGCDYGVGIATVTQVSDATILSPTLAETVSQSSFTSLETTDYVAASFADMYIQTGLAFDHFEVARVYKFVIPAAPCDGMLYYRVDGSIALTPDINAFFGTVRAQVKTLFHIEGDGTDPTNLGAYDLMWSLGTSNPNFDQPIFRTVFRTQTVPVTQGQRANFHIAVRVYMNATDGQASFSSNGSPPVGNMLVRRPLTVLSDYPGVLWQFYPS